MRKLSVRRSASFPRTFQNSGGFFDSPRRAASSGYALVVLMLFAALILIGITAALPDIKTQAKREKELELQFRAMQYLRAIQAYNRKFPNQWPTSIDALMNTNNVRFLRKKWKDPMTKDGDWRFLHLGPNGAVVDSQVSLQGGTNVPSATGSSTPAGGLMTPTGPGGPGGFSLGAGSNPSDASLSTTEISNLPIVGVASRSTAEAIMSCNGYTHYNEWEYIALPGGRYAGTGCYEGVPITMLPVVGAVSGVPAPGVGTTPQGTSPTQNPFSTPTSQSPFGGIQPSGTTSPSNPSQMQKRDR